jgi:formate dehydrogenase maturation protein FdhE
MFAEMDDFYQRMKNRLEQCRKERTELEEILDFYGKVLSAQQEAQQETRRLSLNGLRGFFGG